MHCSMLLMCRYVDRIAPVPEALPLIALSGDLDQVGHVSGDVILLLLLNAECGVTYTCPGP